MERMDTTAFFYEIGHCEDKAEYEELVREHRTLYAGWQDYISPLLHRKCLTTPKIAEGLGVSKSCASKFIYAIPAKRENVIMMALMLGMSVERTNDMLMRWAKFQKLYPKHPKDFIYIYLLENGGTQCPRALFDAYYGRYKELYQEYQDNGPQSHDAVMDTAVALSLIQSGDGAKKTLAPEDAQKDSYFDDTIRQLLVSFDAGYQKLMDYIDALFIDTEREANQELGLTELKGGRRNTPNSLFQNEKPWLDRYFRKMRDLRRKHEIPERTFLIALGLRMSLGTDGINELLNMAGMGPLCPKDRIEGSIVFYLEELYCQFPTYFAHPATMSVAPEYLNLMDYSSAEGRGGGVKLPSYIHLDADDYPKERLADYIRRRLEETNIFEEDDKTAVEKFLQLL